MTTDLFSTRLRLRPVTTDDGDAVYNIVRDPSYWRHLACIRDPKRPYQRAEATRHIAELLDLELDGLPNWVLMEGNDALGLLRFTPSRDGDGDWELGYGLRPDAWGRGLASEAVAVAVQWWRTNGDGTHLVARIAPENAASRRVLLRAGFNADGIDAAGRERFVLDALNARA